MFLKKDDLVCGLDLDVGYCVDYGSVLLDLFSPLCCCFMLLHSAYLLVSE